MVMNRRSWTIVGSLLAAGILLAAWTAFEAANQRKEMAETLTGEAQALASALGPALEAASSAERELDELVTWRLLDNARFVALLWGTGDLPRKELEQVLDLHGLQSIVLLEQAGEAAMVIGEEVPPDLLGSLGPLRDGSADELVLAEEPQHGDEHVAVAVRAGAGRVVVVRSHTGWAMTFVGSLGIDNLLDSVVRTGRIAYLAYAEMPDGIRAEASWDGGAVPEADQRTRAVATLRGRPVFEVVVPVEAPAGMEAILRVGLDGEPIVRATTSATRRTTLVGLLLIGFALSVAAWGMVRQARAAEREEATRRLAASELARQRNERLAAAGTLTAGLAHEVRSPLNSIALAAQRLERRLGAASDDGEKGDEGAARMATTIRGEVRRLEHVLEGFLQLARPGDGRRDETDLADIARGVAELLRGEAASHGVRIDDVRGSAVAAVDPDAVRRALINLVRNAIEASPAGRSVEMVVEQSQGKARLRVLDRGCGIDPAEHERLFEPFRTSRAEGSGLGLALARRVAVEHGGNCCLRTRESGGTEAVLEFDLAGLPATARQAPEGGGEPGP